MLDFVLRCGLLQYVSMCHVKKQAIGLLLLNTGNNSQESWESVSFFIFVGDHFLFPDTGREGGTCFLHDIIVFYMTPCKTFSLHASTAVLQK